MSRSEPRPSRRRARLAAAALLATCLLSAPLCGLRAARADGGDAPSPGGSSVGQGASLAGPILAPAVPLRMDARVDASAYTVDRRVVASAVSVDPRAPSQEVPYRVEPKIDGQPANPWDLPPEKPDPRDFEEAQTFDAIAVPHYTIHEEIWNNVEDLITADGTTRYGGLAFVPFWARNTIRYGRWSFFPFLHTEAVWYSNLGGFASSSTQGQGAFEFLVSAGVMAEYFASQNTKVKAALRVDYQTYSDVYADAYTYFGGASIEHQFGQNLTVEAGFEADRTLVPYDLLTTAGSSTEEPLFQRERVFADLRWDRILGPDWRLDVGGAYQWVDEVEGTDYGGDYQQIDLYGRLSVAVMRHEGFAYLQYDYTKRNAEGDSSDLDSSQGLRLGVSGIQPFGRTRRIEGDIWVGYQWQLYSPSTELGSVGAGGDTNPSTFTFGGSLTYRPSAYTSSYLTFEHGTSFSAIANYNTTDTLYLGVTQNLSQRLLSRIAFSATRVEPEQDGDDSWLVGAGIGFRYVLTDNLDLTTDYQYLYRFAGAGYSQEDSSRIAVGATLQLR